MALASGTRLGPFEILSTLGAGGMGEVYKARDTRLDRTVAIKIMPEVLAGDPQFRERFDREARAISKLAHPNICTLFDVGHQEGIDFLVLEHLEGESLADRLERSPNGLPVNEALRIAIEIAAALDAAHRGGIVHRDLKPGNIFLVNRAAGPARSGSAGTTADRKVSTAGGSEVAKLLDFGLAKTAAPAVALSGTMLPTAAPAITAAGTILGTFQYMAPEQVEGLDADARTDIFAFGAVLYEMITGRKAFEGKTRASLLGAILKDEPRPVSTVTTVAPTSLDRIVSTCLAKDPDDRWQTARDLLRELKWVADGTVSDASGVIAPAGSVASTRARSGLSWMLAAGALALALGAVVVLWVPWRKAAPAPLLRLSSELGADVSLVPVQGASAIISPDGQMLAFTAPKNAGGGSPQLYVRHLAQLQATALAGTEDASNPFFSPDGQWIAFFAGGKLKKISVTGGAAVTLCDAPAGRGGSWDENGTIVFQPASASGSALSRVSSAGGTPEPATKLADKEAYQRYPQVLPGGKAVLYMASSSGSFADANLVVQPLPAGAPKIVQRGAYYGRYLPSGHLVYMHDGTLFAATFDLDRLELTGQPVPVLEGVATNTNNGGAQVSISETGTLVYLPGQSVNNELPISWLDHEGKTAPLRATPSNWSNPAFSPDGRRLAVDISDGAQSDVWIYEWARDTLSRLTFDATDDARPTWTPDGRRVSFGSKRGDKATTNLYWQRADGTGDAQRLTESKNNQANGTWHPSGKFLAFEETNQGSRGDLMILPMEGDEATGWKPGKPTVFLQTPFNEGSPMFSPDGRWIAYISNESGRNEIYVRPFPGPGGKWQISTGNADDPTWSRARHELFYTSAQDLRLMVAPYTVEGDSFRAEKPKVWSEARIAARPRPPSRDLDLHPDGDRFAIGSGGEQGSDKLDKVVFIFNFFDELRRLAPGRK